MTFDWLDWASVAAGGALGWLAHWVLDSAFWRSRARVLDVDTLVTAKAESDTKISALESEVSALREQIQRLAPYEQKSAEHLQQISRLDQANLELQRMAGEAQRERDELAKRVAELASNPAPIPTPAPAPDPEPEPILVAEPVPAQALLADDLTLIEGIDSNSQSLLHEAGIRSYSDLAQCSPDALFAIVRPRRGEPFEPEAWVAMAAAKAKEAVAR